MPYTLSQAADAKKIKEQEYATAGDIMFTAFTSCIGIIAKSGMQLTAVHLVMKAADDTLFDAAAATAVHQLLPKKYEKVWVIGCVDLWRNKQNGVAAAFEKLIAGISSIETVQIYSWKQGTYGATIDGNDIEVQFG